MESVFNVQQWKFLKIIIITFPFSRNRVVALINALISKEINKKLLNALEKESK